MKFCTHDSRIVFERLIGPLRQRARELGYALAVHGSLRRDIDLVAIPWVEKAADPRVLVEGLRQVCQHACRFATIASKRRGAAYWLNGSPGDKPHGRLTWIIHIYDRAALGAYVDLSVMPCK